MTKSFEANTLFWAIIEDRQHLNWCTFFIYQKSCFIIKGYQYTEKRGYCVKMCTKYINLKYFFKNFSCSLLGSSTQDGGRYLTLYCRVGSAETRLNRPFHGVNQNTANRQTSCLLQCQQPIISSGAILNYKNVTNFRDIFVNIIAF